MVHAGQFLDMLSTSFLTQCAESTRKRAVPVQSICRPINFEGYYIYVNMIGQQLTDSCK